MPLLRIATVGCLFLAALISGCGESADSGGPPAPPAGDSPDAGLEASKKIMEMQPPPPTKKARN